MNVIVDFCVIPIGVGVSLSPYVAACQRVLADSDLEFQMHSYGTTVQGEWEAVFEAIGRCHEVVHELGAPRISTSARIGTRTDKSQSIQEKVDSVDKLLQADKKQ